MKFLRQLRDTLQANTSTEFAAMCGREPQIMASYIDGTRKPRKRALEQCVLNAAISRVFDEPPAEDTSRGRKTKTLRNRVVSKLFAEEVQPLWEIQPVPDEQTDLPISAGVYVLYDSGAYVLYVGQASNFRNQVWQTLDRRIPVQMRLGPDMNNARPTLWELASYLSLYQIDNAALRHNVEALLIRVTINQTHNRNLGHFRAA